MKLKIGSGREISEPSRSQVATELAALPGGADSFVILSRGELTYLQTAGSSSEGFLLEYQDGSVDQHYRSPESDVPLTTVTRAFQLYLTGDPSFQSLVSWERDDLGQYSAGAFLSFRPCSSL